MMRHRVSAIATALVLLVPLGGWSGPTAQAPEAGRSATVTASTRSASAAAPAHAPVTTAPVLRLGQHGPAVLALQRRLAALGYWLGTPDGRFGPLTQQAVYALQKAAGLARDGVVGPATTKALRTGVRPSARTRHGRVVEVHLARQLLLLVQDGKVVTVLNTSTGSGRTYVAGGRVQRAVTPVGRHVVSRQVDGMRVSPLGALWRPKYFSGGIAVHGYPSVPPWPASHGCVRVSMSGMDHVWASGRAPVGTPVWVV